MAAKTTAEVIGGYCFVQLFDHIMLCDEAPSVDILLSTIRSSIIHLQIFSFCLEGLLYSVF